MTIEAAQQHWRGQMDGRKEKLNDDDDDDCPGPDRTIAELLQSEIYLNLFLQYQLLRIYCTKLYSY